MNSGKGSRAGRGMRYMSFPGADDEGLGPHGKMRPWRLELAALVSKLVGYICLGSALTLFGPGHHKVG